MPATEKSLKQKLLDEIQNRIDNFDNETDKIDGETYTNLFTQVQKLNDDAKKAQENENEKLRKVEEELKLYDQGLNEAKVAAADRVNDEDQESNSSNDDAEEVNEEEIDGIAASDQRDADYYLAMSTVLVVSASDRSAGFAKLNDDAHTLKERWTKIQKALEQSLARANEMNYAVADQQMQAFRLDLAKSILKKVDGVEKNLSRAEEEQTEYGYYSNKELDGDSAEFLPTLSEAQNKLMEYFKRGNALDTGFNMEISSAAGLNDGIGRVLQKNSLPDNKQLGNQARFIPSSFKNEKNKIIRYATLQAHDEGNKVFRSQVYLTEFPKNSRIRDGFSFNSIPCKEMIVIAHDAVENHRMMNKYYPESRLIFSFGKGMPHQMAEAIALYCKFMHYPYEIKGIADLKIDDKQTNLLQKKLGDELKDLDKRRLAMNSPQQIEEPRVEPALAGMRR